MKQIFVILCLLFTAVRAFAEPATAILRVSAAVRAEGVFSTDVIEGVPGLPRIRIAAAPAAGAWAAVSREEARAALSKAGFEIGATNWAGPATTRVSRLMRDLGEAEVRDLLAFELQRRYARERGEIELRFTRPWRTVSIPDETFEVRLIDSPASGIVAAFSVRFELRAKDEVLGQWFQPLAVRHWCELPVAVSAIRRGTALPDAEIVFERRDILGVRSPLFRLPETQSDHEFAESVGAGQPLGERSLRLRTVIARGRMVDALVRSGSLEITTKVEALEDGAPGQFIRIRNPRSKREFRGRVQSEDSVIVPL
jgi:flagella basal body P-ring formation protein FlgA